MEGTAPLVRKLIGSRAFGKLVSKERKEKTRRSWRKKHKKKRGEVKRVDGKPGMVLNVW